MTTIEDRVRQIGRELDRASSTYGERAPEPSYVRASPVVSAKRPRVLVAAGVLVVACVAMLLVLRRSDQQSSTVTEPPEGLAISATLGGDSWIWPSADAGVVATSAEQVAREFANRVLRLSDAVVVNETTDGAAQPTWIRIETEALRLRILVAPQGSADRWVIHQLNTRGPTLFASVLEVPSPANAASAELYVRYTNGIRAFHLAVGPVGGVINLPVRDLVATVIAVFRNSDGEVIESLGGEFNPPTTNVPSRPTSEVSPDERPVFVPGAKPASVPGTNVGSR